MKCKNCGSSDFEETWIDYPAKIYDEIEYIETEGFE
jgi:RNA polymerase subunit RPABC4/transcription elongation factor Spt4